MNQAEHWATIIPLVLGLVAPLVASFLSRQHWPSEVTAGLTVVTSAVFAFVSEAFAAGNYSISVAMLKALGVYVVASVARSQWWKNTETDGKLLAFPHPYLKSGVQPGAEPEMDAAA